MKKYNIVHALIAIFSYGYLVIHDMVNWQVVLPLYIILLIGNILIAVLHSTFVTIPFNYQDTSQYRNVYHYRGLLWIFHFVFISCLVVARLSASHELAKLNVMLFMIAHIIVLREILSTFKYVNIKKL